MGGYPPPIGLAGSIGGGTPPLIEGSPGLNGGSPPIGLAGLIGGGYPPLIEGSPGLNGGGTPPIGLAGSIGGGTPPWFCLPWSLKWHLFEDILTVFVVFWAFCLALVMAFCLALVMGFWRFLHRIRVLGS